MCPPSSSSLALPTVLYIFPACEGKRKGAKPCSSRLAAAAAAAAESSSSLYADVGWVERRPPMTWIFFDGEGGGARGRTGDGGHISVPPAWVASAAKSRSVGRTPSAMRGCMSFIKFRMEGKCIAQTFLVKVTQIHCCGLP